MADDTEDGDISSIGGDGSAFSHGRGHGVGSGHGVDPGTGAHGGWLRGVLQTMAETQRALVEHRGSESGGKANHAGAGPSRRNLSKVQIDDFHGGSTVTTHQYRMWEKSVQTVRV